MNKLKLLSVALFIFLVIIFFKPLFLQGQLPIPSDTIVGLYNPFREIYFRTNPNGIPYKNFLITDPVRQQIPWKNLVVQAEKKLALPVWNPYNFAGAPLIANFQSAAFYPLNLLFLFLPFSFAWSLLIFSQPLLAGIFLFFYLRNLKLSHYASLLGAISFSFCGFSIAWMEWGTILSTALWLPLILLATDKILQTSNLKPKTLKIVWSVVFLFSLLSSFFAGHLQTFFYVALLMVAYFVVRWLQSVRKIQTVGLFLILSLVAFILSLPQLLPTLTFITLSARNVDLVGWTQAGWFIPWQNLVQFIAPDFFGNPTTLNYFGIWNYGEFIGYIGIFPLVMALFALFFRRGKTTLFFGTMFFLSLIFALPTIFAQLPYKFAIPFISTAQPTRLLFVADFSLSVLAALGIDYFFSLKNRKYILPVLIALGLSFVGIWSFVLMFHGGILSAQNLSVARQNLIFPTLIFIMVTLTLLALIPSSRQKLRLLMVGLLFAVTVVDLFRFGWKFEPFTNKNYFFPSTSAISFLQNQNGQFRVMSTDSKIFPPNFSIMYKLQTLDGYDPLYLQRYGELMAASGRGLPNISTPFGFNRIITPQNPLSLTADLLGVRYILSLDAINSPKLKPVFTDGTVKIYENTMALPRAFFVNTTFIADSKQQAINALFDTTYSLNRRAVVEDVQNKQLFESNWSLGKVQIADYSNDKVVIKTDNPGEGFLVLTDSFYPNWHAKIDGKETLIYLTDYNFRGIIISKGQHTIEFYDTLF